MGFFRRNRPEPENRTATLGQLQAILDRSGMTTAGVSVTDDKALTSPAVWACLELIAGVGSSLPLDEFRKVGDDQIPVTLSGLFADPDPDPSVTAVGFRAQVLRSAAARGNAYVQLLGAEMGQASGGVTIHPDRCRWRYENREWNLYVDNVKRDRWPYGDIWHFALFQQPGCPIGLNPVEYHRLTIGGSLAAQNFGAQYFNAGGHPTVIVKMPNDPGPEAAKDVKARIIDATRGNREPMIFPNGWELEKVTIPPEDAQFLETQRYGVEETARIFLGGFPELIGGSVTGGGSVTYANREQRMADFIALSLAPRYLVPLEASLSGLVPPGRYVKHNVDALLRADLKARYESYEIAAKIGNLMGEPLLTNDEMRRLENLPRLTPEQKTTAKRSMSAAEAIQKIYLGVGRVVTADEARDIVNDLSGTDLPTPSGDLGTPSPSPAMRAEARQTVSETRGTPDMHFHLPDSVQVELRQDPPVVNVAAPIVNLPAPIVNVTVEPTPVTVEIPPWPAPVINVTSPDVFVTVQEPERGDTVKTVSLDVGGRKVTGTITEE